MSCLHLHYGTRRHFQSRTSEDDTVSEPKHRMSKVGRTRLNAFLFTDNTEIISTENRKQAHQWGQASLNQIYGCQHGTLSPVHQDRCSSCMYCLCFCHSRLSIDGKCQSRDCECQRLLSFKCIPTGCLKSERLI